MCPENLGPKVSWLCALRALKIIDVQVPFQSGQNLLERGIYVFKKMFYLYLQETVQAGRGREREA